jgi:hypothetical protein
MKYSFTTALLLVATAAPSFGQPAAQPYTVINGKEHPEQIDDATAYLHFFASLTRKPGEVQDSYDRRRRAYAHQMNLNEELNESEIAALFASADRFAQRIQSLTQNGPVDSTSRKETALGVMAQLQQVLGPHARYVLTTFVNTVVKPSITIYNPTVN